MAAINKYCPRSGKPIAENSLAEYRQYVVGFCNPGCRDDFLKNPRNSPKDCNYFDILIKENQK